MYYTQFEEDVWEYQYLLHILNYIDRQYRLDYSSRWDLDEDLVEDVWNHEQQYLEYAVGRANLLFAYWREAFLEREAFLFADSRLDPLSRKLIADSIAPEGRFQDYFPVLPRRFAWRRNRF